jgi:hypothetical protein
VIGWKGATEFEDIIVKERMEGVTYRTMFNSRDVGFCPGCEAWYERKDINKHAITCMACKGILFEGTEDDEVTVAGEPAPYPMLQSPKWSGYPPKLRRTAIIDEEVAPDVMTKKIGQIEEAANDAAAAPTTPGDNRIPEWMFPRTPEVKIGPPLPGAGAASDLEVRKMLRRYVEHDSGNCWVCGYGGHENWECPNLQTGSTEGAKMLHNLLETRMDDEADQDGVKGRR